MRAPRPSLLVFWLALAISGGCGRTAPPPPPATRVLPLQEISDYAQATTPEIYLRTVQDVLPGGLAAAMTPVLVDWDQSDPAAADGSYVLRNVNDGGNPLAGSTVLRSVRIPAHGLAAAEFILVPLDGMGTKGLVAHGMLRFVFAPDNAGHRLGPAGDERGPGAALGDLVLSWEAWRAPGVDFDFVKGADPATFGLSLRAFSGPQRFLEDVLSERDWYSYRLRLPGGTAGLDELLYDTLVLGDGAGRHALSDIFARGIDTWLAEAPVGTELDQSIESRWQELMALVHGFEEPTDERLRLEEEDRNYQTMLRSCSTMALYCINVAAERLRQRGLGVAEGIRPTAPAVMGDVAPWMKDLAGMKTVEIFLLAPAVVNYVSRNTTVIPTRVPHALAEAGLLLEGDGKARPRHYSAAGMTPYGDAKAALIR